MLKLCLPTPSRTRVSSMWVLVAILAALSPASASETDSPSIGWTDDARTVWHWQSRLPKPVDETESLRSLVFDDAPVRVIVYLNSPTLAEHPSMGARMIAAQRDKIGEMQTRVIRALGGQAGQVHRRFKTIPAFVMSVNQRSLEQLAMQPEVSAIVRDIAVPPALDGTVSIIEGEQMHDLGWTGRGWAVAVLDTGVDRDHPMFLDGQGNSRVVAEACFSSNSPESESLCPNGTETQWGNGAAADCDGSISGCGHGTHVTGIAAGGTVNLGGLSFSGVAPEADIIAIQVFSKFPPTECGSSASCVMSWSSDQAAALEWLLDQDQSRNGPWRIASANMSLGGERYYGHCDSAPVAPAIRNLKNIGVATAIASGNSGYSDSISMPACVSDAISVGATTNSDLVAHYTSASDSLIDLYAPGSSVISAANGGGYVALSGTSMATPHVAGAWAVMRQAGVGNESATGVEALQTVLQETGRFISARQSGSSAIELGYAHPRIALKQAFDRHDSSEAWLTVRPTGLGAGAVISSPAGIDCGTQCSMVVEPGDIVILQAIPNEGSELIGFEGCTSVVGNQCRLEITTSTTVNVSFGVAAPSNDHFVNAKPLTGTRVIESFSTIGATSEANEPSPLCDDTGGSSVWFSWALPEQVLPSDVRVDTIGSEFDTILDIFTGTQLTDLTSLGCDVGSWAANWTDATVSFEATPGVTYFFRVSGYFGTEGNAQLNLSLSTLTYTLAVAIDGSGGGEITGDGLQCGLSNTPCTATYTVEDVVTLAATPDPTSEFDGWTGDCAAFKAGPQCQLTMRGNRSTTAFFKPKVANDNLGAASSISFTEATPFEDQVDLSFASTEADEVISSCGAIQSSIWYVWTAPSDVGLQPVTIDVSESDSGFDLGVAVYTTSQNPPQFDSLAEVDCIERASASGTQALLRLVDDNGVSIIQPNQTYYIQLGRSGALSGTVRVRVSFGNQLLSIQQEVIDRLSGQPYAPGGVKVLNNGAFCFTENCVQELATGQWVKLRAYTPTEGGTNPSGFLTHGFVGWQGCDEVLGRECWISMRSDRTVVAEYAQDDARALEVQLLGRLKGRVYSQQLGIDCNNTISLEDDRTEWQSCQAGYRFNESVSLRADVMNAAVVRWSENCQASVDDAWACDIMLGTDQRVTAEFLEASTLTTSVLGVGEIRSATNHLGRNLQCVGECFYYPAGQVVQLEAVADPRYRFQQWTGACRGSEPTCEVTLDIDRDVGAIFEIIPTVFKDQFGAIDN